MRRSRFNNDIVIAPDGTRFDSRKEYGRWCQLQMLEKTGYISDLKRQVPFELIPTKFESYERYSQKTGRRLKDGRRLVEHAATYVADFTYMRNGKMVVEDVKGAKTDTYILKRKLMLHVHGIRIKEV